MVEWLTWLSDARRISALITDDNVATLHSRLMKGETAYLVERPNVLAEAEDALGADLKVVRLPTGPVAESHSLLKTWGFALAAALGEEQSQLALEFVTFATNQESQSILVESARLLPANIGVPLAADDPLTTFAEAVEASEIYPNRQEMLAVGRFGAQFYTLVLSSDELPAELPAETDIMERVRTIVKRINGANGFETAVESTPDASEE